MFRCQLCNMVVPARTRATKVVMETRERTYTQLPPRDGRRHDEFVGKVSKGTEIVREVLVCPDCAVKTDCAVKV